MAVGDVIAVDLMTNQQTGQKIVDYVVIQGPSQPWSFDRLPVQREFAYTPGTPRDFSVEDASLRLAEPRVSITFHASRTARSMRPPPRATGRFPALPCGSPFGTGDASSCRWCRIPSSGFERPAKSGALRSRSCWAQTHLHSTRRRPSPRATPHSICMCSRNRDGGRIIQALTPRPFRLSRWEPAGRNRWFGADSASEVPNEEPPQVCFC